MSKYKAARTTLHLSQLVKTFRQVLDGMTVTTQIRLRQKPGGKKYAKKAQGS